MTLRNFAGSDPVLSPGVYVDESALVIGDVTIGRDASIWPMCILRGDIHGIRIGERSNIQDGSILHVTHDSAYAPGGHPLLIGDGVTVGHGVILHGCEIQANCLIGMGSVVMDGAVVEPEVILGAGSLVPPGKRLQGPGLWLGRPARRARSLTADEQEYLGYSAANYVRLKDRYLAEQRRGRT